MVNLELKTIHLLREAYCRFPRLGMLWSMGKDSTALLWLVRKAFEGQIPFPVFHVASGRMVWVLAGSRLGFRAELAIQSFCDNSDWSHRFWVSVLSKF